ncbi:unnamed protein product, partial [Closterium sp. NIES-54]
WQTRDAAAHLAIRNHLPITERAHFSQHRTAKTLRALHRKPPPPTYFTLYFLVTRLPDTLSSIKDHFLALDPNILTVNDFEKHLLAADKNILAVGAARGTPRSPLPWGSWSLPLYHPHRSPRWSPVHRRDVPIFDLDYEAILAAMYALSIIAEGDCYLCVPPDPGIAPGIAPAALGACESAPLGTAPAQALHTFTLDSGASRCFFRDSTTVTPLPAPVPVSLADPSGGLVLARSSTVLPCLAVTSGELSGLHLPSFSTNLVSNAVLQPGSPLPAPSPYTEQPGGLAERREPAFWLIDD